MRLYSTVKPKLVADIPDDVLAQMSKQIQPVCKMPNHRFRLINTDGVDLSGIAFTWSPKFGKYVKLYDDDDIEIITYHTWGFYGFFKPSLKEVYAAIYRYIPDWSSLRFFWLKSHEVEVQNIIGDHHYCRCSLFGEEATDVTDSSWDEDTKHVNIEV